MDSLNTCLLCLLQDRIIKNISLADDDNIIIAEKLKFVLPEENITSCYNKIVNYNPHIPKHICIYCLADLNHVYKFKLKCMKNLTSLSESIGEKLTEKTQIDKTPSNKIKVNLKTTQQDNYGQENVVIKLEPDVQDNASNFEEIVVKEERHDLNEEVDIPEDPLLGQTFTNITQRETTSAAVRMDDSDSESLPSDIEPIIESVSPAVLPIKSRDTYEQTYAKLEEWSRSKGIKNICCEKVLLVYFEHLSKERKPSSLWAYYSMLRSVISVKQNVDISKYSHLNAFLKRKSAGYRPKKTKILRREDITKFLLEADDRNYLMIKVALIIGIVGACRREELTNLQLHNVQNEGQCIHIIIPKTKTKPSREFFITRGNIEGINMVETVRKYLALRPETDHGRFFVAYRNAKCLKHPVGINAFGKMPSNIAAILNLPNPQQYTGHCFRRSSASLLADSRTVKRLQQIL